MKTGTLRFTDQGLRGFIGERGEQTMEPRNNSTVLMVDDDPDDFFLAKHAFRKSGLKKDFRMVSDGEELMDYLYRRGNFATLESSPLPCLILLDLNMPRKDGREVLEEVKKDPEFRRIPIIVFTTSGEETDIASCYELGANSYITKPAKFDTLVEVMTSLVDYWLKVVRLPGHPAEHLSG
jgi:CheY-like chemotaxis protein